MTTNIQVDSCSPFYRKQRRLSSAFKMLRTETADANSVSPAKKSSSKALEGAAFC